jgi:polyphenol oxidase
MTPDLKKAIERVQTGFEQSTTKDTGILTVPAFSRTGLVRHGFTSRHGGISQAPYDTLNLSWKRYDSASEIDKNYEIAAEAMGIDAAHLVHANTVHGDEILLVGAPDRGRGNRLDNPCIPSDALITETPDVALVTMHADCLPVFILDATRPAVALCHSGWKGTAARIAVKAVKQMQERFGTLPKDCLAAVGPGIRSCCFEVDANVASIFQEEFPEIECVVITNDGKCHVDLELCCLAQLLESGIEAQNITRSGLCTSCRKDLFFSYRRDKGDTGAMAAIIELVGPKG